MTQFGNDQACDNCGDEWAPLDERDLCPECAEEFHRYAPSDSTASQSE